MNGEIKEINSLVSAKQSNECPFEIGKAYLFRLVTHIEVGRVKRIIGQFVELENAGWIKYTGRFHECLAKGVFNEDDPYPLFSGINMQSLINYAPWPHPLPKEQKLRKIYSKLGVEVGTGGGE